MKYLTRISVAALVGLGAVTATIGPAQAASTPVVIGEPRPVVKPKPLSHNANGTHIVYIITGHRTASSELSLSLDTANASMHYLRRVTDAANGSSTGGDDRPYPAAVQRRDLCRLRPLVLLPNRSQVGGTSTIWMAPTKP